MSSLCPLGKRFHLSAVVYASVKICPRVVGWIRSVDIKYVRNVDINTVLGRRPGTG